MYFYRKPKGGKIYEKNINSTPKTFLIKKGKKKDWQLAIFAYTIFAVKVLNFCVRDGNRCIHFAIVTNTIIEK